MKPWIWQLPGWPAMRFDMQALAGDLDAARLAQGRVLGQLDALGLGGAQAVTQDLWVQDALATAAIEGERLDLAAVRSSVARRLGLVEPAVHDRHVDGLVDVMQDAVGRHDAPLDADRLWRWHSALFPGGTTGVRRIVVGRWRDHEDAMQIVSGLPGREVVHYTAPPSRDVAAHMAQFLQWFALTAPRAKPGHPQAQVHGLVRAALAHLWFETIHPFEDGNGRLGRAIADMAIAQDLGSPSRAFSLSRQLLKARAGYYDALSQAQAGPLDVTSWVGWFVRAFTAGCEQSLAVVRQSLDLAAFWQRAGQHPVTERQRKVLDCLVRAGNGGFLGGMTADKYVKLTGASKATATRDLATLAQWDLLVVQGVGKATRYAVNVPGWNLGG